MGLCSIVHFMVYRVLAVTWLVFSCDLALNLFRPGQRVTLSGTGGITFPVIASVYFVNILMATAVAGLLFDRVDWARWLLALIAALYLISAAVSLGSKKVFTSFNAVTIIGFVLSVVSLVLVFGERMFHLQPP